ncbi:uncharacterized protein LOC129224808 [Uloborus diversus]|uniref:uncharacterized protein LOC129224808 n=1 Tax=Uloborus diversus TaxID=327109 RepID=UPI0024099E2A|nr:uncharacterized protein LOC129224808 [Uloborus diversus]
MKIKDEIRANATEPVPRIFKKCLSEIAVDIETASAIPPFQQIKTELYKVFCSEEDLEKLCQSDSIHMDGTFKIVPKLFSQLYTIHGSYLRKIFPLAFCLIGSKSKETYIELFSAIKEHARSHGLIFHPKFVMMDFETACIAALEEVFKGVVVKGCFFHFSQCIWKQVQRLGLVTEYAGNKEVRNFFRKMAALALVPPTLVPEAFLIIQENQPSTGEEDTFISYMAETWLDEQDAKFPISIWNHFDTNGARTNNVVEGWHSSLNNKASIRHLDLFSMIKLLQEEEAANQAVVFQLDGGQEKIQRVKTSSFTSDKDYTMSQSNVSAETNLKLERNGFNQFICMAIEVGINIDLIHFEKFK